MFSALPVDNEVSDDENAEKQGSSEEVVFIAILNQSKFSVQLDIPISIIQYF